MSVRWRESVRAHTKAKELEFKLIVGSEFRLVCGLHLVVLALSRAGYGSLCRLVTRGRRAAEKGEYRLERGDVKESLKGTRRMRRCCGCRRARRPGRTRVARSSRLQGEGAWVHEHFTGRAWVAVELLRDGTERGWLALLTELGASLGLPLVATGDVHLHVRGRRRCRM